MSSPNETSRVLTFGRTVAVFFLPLAALVTRITMGWMFFGTGMGKWKNFERTTAFFTELGIPAAKANAGFIASLELVGGLCLILGLGTRMFSFLLACTMTVALMTAHRTELLDVLGIGTNETSKGLFDITPVPFLIMLLWLIGYGAGAISADRFLFRKYDPASQA